MKTETQIAQENVDEIRDTASPTQKGILREQARELKEKDQRFLDWLEKNGKESMEFHTCGACDDVASKVIIDKITDLKQAIKLYKDVGI